MELQSHTHEWDEEMQRGGMERGESDGVKARRVR